MSAEPSNVLIISKVPKVLNGQRREKIKSNDSYIYKFNSSEISTSASPNKIPFKYIKADLDQYSTELLNTDEKKFSKTICNGGMCCNVNLGIDVDEINIKNSRKEYYRYINS